MRLVLLSALLAACAGPAPTAQTAAPAAAPAADDRTAVEAAVAETIAGPGVHVVHFWAPWCGNSRAELEGGLYEVVEAHPDVSFAFVTIWNDGDDGADRLARYGVEPGANVAVYGQPTGPWTADVDARRVTFLGLPLTWTPTTWIFNREGALAYAFNYGELSPEDLAAAIADARSEWAHD